MKVYRKVTKRYALSVLSKKKRMADVVFDYGKGKQELVWDKYVSARKDAVPHLYTFNKRGLSHPVFKPMLEKATFYTVKEKKDDWEKKYEKSLKKYEKSLKKRSKKK